MKRLILVCAALVIAGCECGPGLACRTDGDCPSWGHCVKSDGLSGHCAVRAAVDAGSDGGSPDGGADAGTPRAALRPAQLDIGNVGCGLSVVGEVTLENTGSAPLHYDASTGASGVFSVSPTTGTIGAGQQGTLFVTATLAATTNAGTDVMGTLSVTTNDGAGRKDVPLSARASGVTLTLTPSVASFGVVPVNTPSAGIPLTLTNAGNVPATVRLAQPADAQFSVGWSGFPAAVTLAAGASAPGLLAGFTPSRIAPTSTSAALTVDEPVCGASVSSIPFTGQGTSGVVGFSTTDVFFGVNGRVDCGTQSTSRTFTITNAGNQAFAWTATLAKGSASAFSISPTSGTVPANNGTVTLTVSTTGIPAQATTQENAFGDILSVVTDIANDASHPITLHQTANGAILSFAPSPVEFGQVPVNNTASAPFRVINDGNTAPVVTLTSNNGKFTFTPSSPTPAPEGSTPYTAVYAPGLAVAPEQAEVSLTVAGAQPLCAALPAPLVMTGQGTSGSVSYSPVALDFGAVNCGTSSAARTVTFRNTGNQAYTVTAVLGRDGGSPYSVSLTPPSGEVPTDGGVLVLTVTPQAIPQRSAVTPNLYGDTLTVSTDVAGDTARDIPLRMTARGSIFGVSTGALDFGSVTVGATGSGQFTVSNTGNAAGTLLLSAAQPAIFGVPASANVSGGGAAIQGATFSPGGAMTYSDLAQVSAGSSTVLCQPLPLTSITLSGVGTAGNVMTLSSTNLSFGLVPCGATAMAQSVAITNTSSNTLALTYSLVGGASSPYSVTGPAQVAAGALVNVTVTAKAIPATSSTAPDGFADTLTITGVGGPVNEARTVALHQTAHGAVLSFTPTALSFSAGVGQSQQKSFTVSNAGNRAATLALTVGGANASNFSVSPGSGPAPAGASLTGSATFTAPIGIGTRSADVALTTNDGLCGPLPARLTLTGN